MPQAGVPAPTAPVVRRKKKRKEPTEPPPVAAEAGRPAEIEQKIAAAEARSRSTLPTDFAYEIAATATDEEDAARAAAAVARELSFPRVQDALRDTDPFADPVTGGPLTVKTVRRMEVGAIAAAIAQQFEAIQEAGVRIPSAGRPIRDPDLGTIRRAPKQKIKAGTLASYITALAPLPGNLDFRVALGAAISLAAEGVNRNKFALAIRAFNDWNGETGPLTEAEVNQIMAKVSAILVDKGFVIR